MDETYNVYFDSGDGLELVAAGISAVEYTVAFGPLNYNTEYSWRVDAINDSGTTTGDVWTFTCIKYDPPLPSGMTLDDDGEPTGTPTGENCMLTTRLIVAAADDKIWFEDI